MKHRRKMLISASLIVVLFGFGTGQAVITQASFSHRIWQELLQRHVSSSDGGRTTRVDYAGMQDDRSVLRRYLDSLSEVDGQKFLGWSEDAQLAFLINAYNAWTVELVLTRYPDLDSIRDLGSLFRSPWSRRFVPLFGERVSLDHIEHELIRGPEGYGDPRIHFAVNCASIGCPALRQEAYLEGRLDQQLEEATRLFLADGSRNRQDGDVLRVSEIFKWYQEDFEQGWRGISSVAQFLARYGKAMQLPGDIIDALTKGEVRIRYLKYNWALNGLRD